MSFSALSLLIASLLAQARAQPHLSVWSEFLPYHRIQAALPALKQADTGLLLAVRPGDLEKPELYSLFSRAREAGVEVRPWLELEEGSGPWSNAWTIAATETLTSQALAAFRAHGIEPGWLVLDLEPPPALLDELAAHAGRFDLIGLWRTLARSSHGSPFCEARARFGALISRLHAQGVKVQAVTSPFVLHDRSARATGVQSALGVPIRALDWDEVSFMAYRVEFRGMLGAVGSDLVRSYARRARKAFGPRAALDLGEVGPIAFPHPKDGFTQPKELSDDMAAARSAGIDNLHVYSLDGILASGKPLDAWLEAVPASKPALDLKARLFLRVLDALAAVLPQPRCQ